MLFDNSQTNLMAALPGRTSITLSYRENYFALAYAALDYTEPSKNQYQFMLEGLEDHWTMAGNNRFARYMNLSPGEYVFKVKGSNSAGVWNDDVCALRIVIEPPFWRTWWFYILSAGSVCAAAVGAYKLRVRQKLRRQSELERVREAENIRVRKRAADDFHDEFGHKLTKISLLSQVIRRALNGSAPDLAVQLDKVIQTSEELSMGMRDFLWTLNPEKDSVHDAVIRLKDFGDELFNSCGVGFEVVGLSDDLVRVPLSIEWRRHVTLLFKEAMHNAAKHAGCRAVCLAVTAQSGTLEIRLTDDGEGFDPARPSDGQGLASMAHRAAKLGGALRVESAPGKGTSVIFAGALPAVVQRVSEEGR
jgi:signal transduction histidine kinase